MNEFKDYILVMENIIPEKLCDDILNEYKNSNEWSGANVGSDREFNNEVRNCMSIGISSNEVIEKNKNIRQKLDDEVFECIKKIIKTYNKKFKNAVVTLSQDSGYDLLKYEKGGFYIEHIDSFNTFYRVVSCSLILNDDFKGGEFNFFNNTLTYSLKKRSAIVFPSNFLYPHSISKITSGTRYSIVTWFN